MNMINEYDKESVLIFIKKIKRPQRQYDHVVRLGQPISVTLLSSFILLYRIENKSIIIEYVIYSTSTNICKSFANDISYGRQAAMI